MTEGKLKVGDIVYNEYKTGFHLKVLKLDENPNQFEGVVVKEDTQWAGRWTIGYISKTWNLNVFHRLYRKGDIVKYKSNVAHGRFAGILVKMSVDETNPDEVIKGELFSLPEGLQNPISGRTFVFDRKEVTLFAREIGIDHEIVSEEKPKEEKKVIKIKPKTKESLFKKGDIVMKEIEGETVMMLVNGSLAHHAFHGTCVFSTISSYPLYKQWNDVLIFKGKEQVWHKTTAKIKLEF